MIRPLYPQGKIPQYPLDKRLGGSQGRSGHGGDEKNSQPRRESNPDHPIVQPVASPYTDRAINLAIICRCKYLSSSQSQVGTTSSRMTSLLLVCIRPLLITTNKLEEVVNVKICKLHFHMVLPFEMCDSVFNSPHLIHNELLVPSVFQSP
jgi:hypothetical protein